MVSEPGEPSLDKYRRLDEPGLGKNRAWAPLNRVWAPVNRARVKF